MPIPTPTKTEKEKNDKQGFISRCMGDETMVKDYKEQKQRAAICYQKWNDRNKKKAKATCCGQPFDFVVID